MSLSSLVEFDARARIGRLHLLVDAPNFCTIPVSVTRRAILNVASPPRATSERFEQYLGFFESIALEKYGRVGPGRQIAVTAEDVRIWRRTAPATAASPSKKSLFLISNKGEFGCCD